MREALVIPSTIFLIGVWSDNTKLMLAGIFILILILELLKDAS